MRLQNTSGPVKWLLHIGAVLACALLLAPFADAADAVWPTRPVKILVGFPGGSTPDMAARALADALSQTLGQPVIVENKPGASGNIATEQVARASDDHTLGVVINGNLTSAKLLQPQLSYDPVKDFTPISLLTSAPLVLVTTPQQPVGTQFLAAARASNGQWNYGSVGNGSVGHLGMEWFMVKAGGITAQQVPYPGNPQIANAMLGGQVQMALLPPGIAMPLVHSGKLRAVGLTGGRSSLVPDVAPLSELGVRDFQLEVWTALVGPARLSRAAQIRLAQAVPAAMRSEAVRQRLFTQGWTALGTSPEGLQNRLQSETAIMSAIIKQRGIKID